MDYNEFKEAFKEDLAELLKEEGHGNVTIDETETQKFNEKYDSFVVRPEGSNIGVNYNIEAAFAKYMDTDEYTDILVSAVAAIEEGFGNIPEIDVKSISDYEQVKEKLSMQVVGQKGNEDLLATVPHKEIEDLAVVYRIDVKEMTGTAASVVVSNNLLNQYGITAEQLHADALANAQEIKPLVIKGMFETLAEMMGPDAIEMLGQEPGSQEMLYVASTKDNIYGAGVIAYENFMDQAAERVGGSFYLLPSSKHEVIVVPDRGRMDFKELENMVQSINATELRPEDKLSDSVYHYDSKAKIFELAEKYEERQAAKEADLDAAVQEALENGERKSLLGDLKEKKAKVADQPKKETPTKAHDKAEQSI